MLVGASLKRALMSLVVQRGQKRSEGICRARCQVSRRKKDEGLYSNAMFMSKLRLSVAYS